MDGRGWTARLYLADDPEAVLDLEHAAQHQVAVAAHLRRPRAGARGAAAPRRSRSQYDRIRACFSSFWNGKVTQTDARPLRSRARRTVRARNHPQSPRSSVSRPPRRRDSPWPRAVTARGPEPRAPRRRRRRRGCGRPWRGRRSGVAPTLGGREPINGYLYQFYLYLYRSVGAARGSSAGGRRWTTSDGRARPVRGYTRRAEDLGAACDRNIASGAAPRRIRASSRLPREYCADASHSAAEPPPSTRKADL